MTYSFLVDTYETERLKVLSAWCMFRDEDLSVRPREGDRRGRSVHEHMVHQCVSEDLWFRGMLGVEAGMPALPAVETRLEFLRHYAAASAARLAALREKSDAWWAEESSFFGETRSRAWILVRRVAHTAHHRGQQTALARMLGLDLHSTYGPTADTGGLMRDQAPVIYAYPGDSELLEGESAGGRKAPLPEPPAREVTERP